MKATESKHISKRALILGLSLALFAGLVFQASGTLARGPHQADTLEITPMTSAGGVSPTVPGNAPDQWFYAYALASGSSLNDSLPVQFVLGDTNGKPGDTVTVDVKIVGTPGLADAVSASSFSIADNGLPVTQSVVINTQTLPDGVYSANLQFSTSAKQAKPSRANIHIMVMVGSGSSQTDSDSEGTDLKPPAGPPIPLGSLCFFTDGGLNPLSDCSGTPVTTSSGGTFVIIANPKGKVVATNPEQFYYNVVWSNPGPDTSVEIDLSSSGLEPMGKNSVHALTFNSTAFTQDASSFDMVNHNGAPCGPAGPCTILVHAGDTLWASWHLEYSKTGTPASQISNTCPGNAGVSATATLKDDSGNTLATGTATASGYLKK
jgi:hypothetical protein